MQLLPSSAAAATREDQQNSAIHVSGLAADTCSVFLKLGIRPRPSSGSNLGRGIVLGYMMDDKQEPRRCLPPTAHPALAARYDTLRLQAQAPIMPKILPSTCCGTEVAGHPDMVSCLADIRKLDGYGNFLLEPDLTSWSRKPSTAPFVVVNLTDIGSTPSS